ncbi:MAG TPA: glycoside hydrolase family 3 N-terminal domain-containing protein [Ktedonobacteraceae bacterium]|nr:glycoside hydrolase family 3 N-terminal domain-containing protein [Ktedonobacteraceae bacterium]
MSLNDEYSPKSSQSSQMEEEEEDGNAPTQPLPRIRASARPIPAPPQQKPSLKEQIAWSSLPPSTLASKATMHPVSKQDEKHHSISATLEKQPVISQRGSNGTHTTPSTNSHRRVPVEVEQIPTRPLQQKRPYQPMQPLQPVPQLAPVVATQRRKKRRLALPVAAVLVVLAVLIVLGGVFAHSFSTGGGTAQGQAPVLPMGHTGAFEGVPLNPHQVNQLQHLVSYMQYKQLASMYVQRMTLDEEIGQLIMVEYSDTSYSSDLNYMLTQLHAGGVIMYAFQMKTFAQTKHDISLMQQNANIPLLVSTDEEGGPYVERLGSIYGTRMDATQIGASGNVNVAIQQGQKVAHDLLALGINENLAPDVDVNLVNGYDMVTRTFGTDPQTVIKYASAYLAAMQSAGAVGCIKHFPGLGDAVSDAHTGLPVVKRTQQQLYDVELAPFKALIQSSNPLDRPGMIMPTDVLMPAIDPTMPAELSPIFMTDILRNQFGYDGVVLTDALYMQGISQKWSMPEAGVLALKAGNDMLLGPNGSGQMLAMINAIKQALQDGTLTKARIDQAATRIIALKMQYHLLPATLPQP